MATAAKILTLPELERRVREAQASGRRVVLCHGCFDLVHPGHVRHLEHAARLGDRLVVTLTGDGLLQKGTGRPLIPQELRCENLAALHCVDWVAVNPDATAAALLERLRPDVYVKGREYEKNADPRFAAERAVVEGYGGRVVFSSGDVVFSSTALIGAMEQALDPACQRLRQLLDQHGIDRARVDRLLESAKGRRVLVAGETITDTYVQCDRPDVSKEGPILALRPLEHRSFDGGAAIIARHLAAMGASPVLLTPLPGGPGSIDLEQRLTEQGVEVRRLPYEGSPIEKQRFLVGTSKVMKLDLGGPVTLDAQAQQRFIGLAVEAARRCDAVILADFGQGLFTAALMTAVCGAVRPHAGVLAGDVSGRRSNLLSMRQMDLVCPSESEVRAALHDHDDGLTAVVWKLLHQTHSTSAIVTLGGEGAITFDRPATGTLAPDDWDTRLVVEHVPALALHAVDELGCGDALLAAATLTRAAGGSLVDAAVLGSIAAAAEAGRLGNAVIGAADLRQGFARLESGGMVCSVLPQAAMARSSPDQLRLAHA